MSMSLPLPAAPRRHKVWAATCRRSTVVAILLALLAGAAGTAEAQARRRPGSEIMVHAWLFGTACPDRAGRGRPSRAFVELQAELGGDRRRVRVRCPGRRYEISGEPTATLRLHAPRRGDVELVLRATGRQIWRGRVGERAGRYVLVELHQRRRQLTARVYVRRRRPDYEE